MRILYVDGGCSGNESKDVSKRRMVMVVTNDLGEVLSEHSEDGGSNNIAELEAVADALRWIGARGDKEVEIRTDSRNNTAWVFGSIGKKLNDRERVVRLRREIDRLRISLTEFRLIWIPREENLAGHYIEKKYGL